MSTALYIFGFVAGLVIWLFVRSLIQEVVVAWWDEATYNRRQNKAIKRSLRK